MKAWTIDAANILQSGPQPNLSPDEVIATNKIQMFLDGDDISFVVAPKGFGKTLLMIAKRLQYHDKTRHGFTLIPGRGLLVDVPKSGAANLDWGKIAIAFFTDRRNWEGVWRTCLSLAIVRALVENASGSDADRIVDQLRQTDPDTQQPKYPFLQRLLNEETHTTPLEYLNCILGTFRMKELRPLLKEQGHLDQLITTIHTPVAVFIDNVDEYFEEHLEKGDGAYAPSVRGVFDLGMWHLSQQALIFAIRTMSKNNHHLDIFASIRKEAYASLEGTAVENIRGCCVDDLRYSKAKLREIFDLNVRKTAHHFLLEPAELSTSPLRALCGFDTVRHAIRDSKEDLFDHIYRHTLKRPRDVIRIGLGIVQLDREERTPESIKDSINAAATDIALDYIQLSLPHTEFASIGTLLQFLQLIPHNILNYQSLRRICASFNGSCEQLACDSCKKMHPFCDLYKMGLLGTVSFDVSSGQARQRFLAPGERTFGEKGLLPMDRSPDHGFYLIHPILNALISGDPRTRINRSVIVGDGRVWETPLLPKTVQKYRMFLSYAHEDQRFADRLAGDLRAADVPIWRDRENIRIGESFMERITKGIEECAYFGVVLSQGAIESGWVADEIQLAMKYEIEKMQVKILPILIGDVWSNVPGEIRDRQYVDFQDDYDTALDALRDRLAEPSEELPTLKS